MNNLSKGVVTSLAMASCMAAPAAMAATKPNVIFIITDQQSYDAIGALKDAYPKCNIDYKTPNMDRLVNEGISFTRNYCSNAVSMPSRFGLFTGRWGYSYGVRNNGSKGLEFDKIREMLPSSAMGNLFLAAGYDTYYGGKVHLPCSSTDVGNNSAYEPPKAYGFEEYYTADERDIVGTKAAAIINERAKSPEKPFLLVASFINPHDICIEGTYAGVDFPKFPPSNKKNERAACVQEVRERADAIGSREFYSKHAPELPYNHGSTVGLPANIKVPTKKFDENYWRLYRWIYRELTTLVDSHIGDILDAVDANPALKKNTYIIFTSDHGEMLGAHKMITKGYPYEECQRVPFIISGPGVKAGDRDDTMICGGMDLIPTMCDLAGVKCHAEPDGVSLAKRALSKGKIPSREAIMVENNNFFTIVSGADKYSYYDRMVQKNGVKELTSENEFFVNVDKDPGEMKNALDSNRKRAAELKKFVPTL